LTYLLAFSCKGRWFCPSCHQKKVQLFGALLEELFRARVITFLAKEGLLPLDRANMLRSWKHSGFNIHRSQRVPPGNREDMERLREAEGDPTVLITFDQLVAGLRHRGS
jgi:hypothetical protein